VDVARDCGYASGNAVRQVVKRLENRAAEDTRLKQLLAGRPMPYNEKVCEVDSAEKPSR
jgi:hypothetical protein